MKADVEISRTSIVMKNNDKKDYSLNGMKADELLKIKGGYKAIRGTLVPMNNVATFNLQIKPIIVIHLTTQVSAQEVSQGLEMVS